MAKFRLVHTSFWNDPRVVEEMTAEDKYFFLYLLTNESTTQIGIYQITKKQIAFDLGYSPESASALLQRFIDHHKLVKYNAETREIAIKNWGKYNLIRGGKPILDCVKSELKNVKDAALIEWVGANVPNDSIRNVYESYYVTCNDTPTTRVENEESSNTNGSYVTSHDTSTISGQEEEKEKEKEEEKDKEQQQEKETAAPPAEKNVAVVNPFNFYAQNGFGLTMNDITREKIVAWCEDLSDELVVHAMQIAMERNRVSWSYAEGILKKWYSQNVKSLADVEALLAQFEAQQQMKNRSYGNQRTENVPEWFGKHQQEKQQRQQAGNEPIDFEAERAKVLAKLGGE